MTFYCKPIIFKDEVGNSGHMPVYMTKEAACADVTLPCDVTIYPGEVVKIDLLIGFEIPNGYKLVMYPRSSLLFNNSVLSPTSTIDSDNRHTWCKMVRGWFDTHYPQLLAAFDCWYQEHPL